MNRDQIKGRAENLKGRAKEAVGAVTGNRATLIEGAIDRAKGALRARVGDIKQGVVRNGDRSKGRKKDRK